MNNDYEWQRDPSFVQIWTGLVGQLVRAREGNPAGPERLDLYSDLDAARRDIVYAPELCEPLIWANKTRANRRHVEIGRHDFWTVVDIATNPNGTLFMIKIVSPSGTISGWTQQFYRLEPVP